MFSVWPLSPAAWRGALAGKEKRRRWRRRRRSREARTLEGDNLFTSAAVFPQALDFYCNRPSWELRRSLNLLWSIWNHSPLKAPGSLKESVSLHQNHLVHMRSLMQYTDEVLALGACVGDDPQLLPHQTLNQYLFSWLNCRQFCVFKVQFAVAAVLLWVRLNSSSVVDIHPVIVSWATCRNPSSGSWDILLTDRQRCVQ